MSKEDELFQIQTRQLPRYDLETMLKDITVENQHHQILEDGVEGYEEW